MFLVKNYLALLLTRSNKVVVVTFCFCCVTWVLVITLEGDLVMCEWCVRVVVDES